MGPFRPNERQTLKSYYEVPPEVLADPEALLSWAGEAIRAGQSSREPGVSLDVVAGGGLRRTRPAIDGKRACPSGDVGGPWGRPTRTP